MPEGFDFAVSGINHNHIYGQVDAMLGAGCRLTAFFAPEDDLAAAFSKAYPQARRVADECWELDKVFPDIDFELFARREPAAAP